MQKYIHPDSAEAFMLLQKTMMAGNYSPRSTATCARECGVSAFIIRNCIPILGGIGTIVSINEWTVKNSRLCIGCGKGPKCLYKLQYSIS